MSIFRFILGANASCVTSLEVAVCSFHTISLMPLAKSGQGSKRRASGSSERLAIEPGEEPLEIEGHGNGKLLEPGFGQANIASPPRIASVDSLRYGTFNACASIVEHLKRDRSFALACRLQRNKEGLGRKGEVTRTVFPAGAQGAERARPTEPLAELNRNNRTAPKAGVRRPGMADLTRRTGHLVGGPINLEMRNVESLSILGLPAHIGAQGTEEIHTVFRLATS